MRDAKDRPPARPPQPNLPTPVAASFTTRVPSRACLPCEMVASCSYLTRSPGKSNGHVIVSTPRVLRYRYDRSLELVEHPAPPRERKIQSQLCRVARERLVALRLLASRVGCGWSLRRPTYVVSQRVLMTTPLETFLPVSRHKRRVGVPHAGDDDAHPFADPQGYGYRGDAANRSRSFRSMPADACGRRATLALEKRESRASNPKTC